MDFSGKPEIDLDNDSADIVLLYDVLHHISNRKTLLDEIYRISKPNVLVSVYLHTHLKPEKISREMESANFCLESEYKNCILNFRKDMK